MLLTCPQCGFSKEIPAAHIPAGSTRVHCPKCKAAFPLKQKQAPFRPSPETPASPQPEAPAGEKVYRARRQRPKAGFWIRLTAWVIDKFLVGLLQTILGILLLLFGVSFAPLLQNGIGELVQLVWLFTIIINMVYFVLFTGYCGQTPGKMAVRIRVIRCDGHSISYGRAFFREVPGKFVSAVILGIGYLMVAFDDQKQGLHDRMADTYVIKL